jgi:hypothetical protein
MTLRGGAEEKKGMKRVMSHEDIQTEAHGEQDTAEARYFAKDAVEGEHRSLYASFATVSSAVPAFSAHWSLKSTAATVE